METCIKCNKQVYSPVNEHGLCIRCVADSLQHKSVIVDGGKPSLTDPKNLGKEDYIKVDKDQARKELMVYYHLTLRQALAWTLSRVPSHNSWNSKLTLIECDEKYYPTITEIKGLPADITLPLPAGIPFYMKYINATSSSRYNVVGTQEVDEAYLTKAKKNLYGLETRKIIPRLGRSTNNHSYPAGAIMKDKTGEAVLCKEQFKGHECDGHYRLELNGNYVCDNCGIIYEYNDFKVAKISYFNNLDHEEMEESGVMSDDEDRLGRSGMASLYQGEEAVGGTEPKQLRFIMDRLTRNILEWRKTIGVKLPEDIHAPKKKVKTVRASDVYNGKFNKLTHKARMAALIHWIKVDKVGDRDELVVKMGIHKTQLVRLLDELVEKGRITYQRDGHKMTAVYVK